MSHIARGALAALTALALAGCAQGPLPTNGVGYTEQHSINADIAASLNQGPTAIAPGMSVRDQPLGAHP